MPDTHPAAAPRAVALADLAPEYYSAHSWRLFPINVADPGETRIEAASTFARLYGAAPELLVSSGLHLLAGPIRRAVPSAALDA